MSTTLADKNKHAAATNDSKLELEEDDDFEEFASEDWDAKDEDPADVNVWEDNWDDDNVEDDFSVQLKAELQNHGVV